MIWLVSLPVAKLYWQCKLRFLYGLIHLVIIAARELMRPMGVMIADLAIIFVLAADFGNFIQFIWIPQVSIGIIKAT